MHEPGRASARHRTGLHRPRPGHGFAIGGPLQSVAQSVYDCVPELLVQPEETAMSKGLDKKKEEKKKPEKTLKEKRAAKKEKKAGK